MTKSKSKKIDPNLNKKTEEQSVGLCFRCEWRARFFETGSGPRCECGMTTRSSYSRYMYTPVRPIIITANKEDQRFPLWPFMLSARCHSVGLANVFLTANIIKGKRRREDKFIKYWLPAKEVKIKKKHAF